LFPQSFLESIKTYLLIGYVHAPDGALCAAHLYLLDSDVLFLFLSASVTEKLPLRPNDFGYDWMAQYASSKGFKTLHLGGGSFGLYQYKRAYSPYTVPYFLGRAVFVPHLYRDLSHSHFEDTLNSATAGFFPIYRAGGG
jgi:hypothetical protein